jgi:lipid-A-disaccharide synthase
MDEIRHFLAFYGIYDLDNSTFERKLTEIRQSIKKRIGLAPDKPSISIMLGSRSNEIERLSSIMIEFVNELNKHYPDHQIIIPIAPNLENVEQMINEFSRKGCIVLRNKPLESLAVSDAAIITSGTSTLQAALLGVPMIVVYKLSPITYFIGKNVVRVKNISLVNLILDFFGYEELRVKELLQSDVNVENIMKELSKILDDLEYRNKIMKGLKIVREPFLNRKASQRVAEIVEEMVGNKDV